MKNTLQNSAWPYDLDNRDLLTEDIPFYLEYAQCQGGEILELSCGTGRVALRLAESGFSVTGLDLSEQMLEVFSHKLAKNPEVSDRITLVRSNMAHFELHKKFDMIIAPFRAFQVLTEDDDISRALACVHQHLTDKGIFIVNVFNPYPIMDESWCYGVTVQWERLDEKTGNYVVKKHWGDRIDTKKQVIYPHFAFEITYPDGRKESITDDLQLKYYDRVQLKTVVEKAGLETIEEYSWYDKTPAEGREIIFVCRRLIYGSN